MIIVGRAENVSGDQCNIVCGENSTIRAALPPGEKLDAKYVQFIGQVDSEGVLQVRDKTDMNDTFDIELYNQAIQLANSTYADLF